VTIAARAATARLPENGRSPGAVSNVLVSVVAGLAAAAAGVASAALSDAILSSARRTGHLPFSGTDRLVRGLGGTWARCQQPARHSCFRIAIN
jgi:hypothetical protein